MKTKPFIFFLVFVLCIHVSKKIHAQATNIQDSLALVDLYNSTDGLHWFNHINWLTGAVNTWYGITVKNTRVTKISLEANGLNGSIPSSLGHLTHLLSLYLPANRLK
jgi:hypothetical protein